MRVKTADGMASHWIADYITYRVRKVRGTWSVTAEELLDPEPVASDLTHEEALALLDAIHRALRSEAAAFDAQQWLKEHRGQA